MQLNIKIIIFAIAVLTSTSLNAEEFPALLPENENGFVYRLADREGDLDIYSIYFVEEDPKRFEKFNENDPPINLDAENYAAKYGARQQRLASIPNSNTAIAGISFVVKNPPAPIKAYSVNEDVFWIIGKMPDNFKGSSQGGHRPHDALKKEILHNGKKFEIIGFTMDGWLHSRESCSGFRSSFDQAKKLMVGFYCVDEKEIPSLNKRIETAVSRLEVIIKSFNFDAFE